MSSPRKDGRGRVAGSRMLRGSCAICRQEEIAINAAGEPHGLHVGGRKHQDALRERRREEKRKREAAAVDRATEVLARKLDQYRSQRGSRAARKAVAPPRGALLNRPPDPAPESLDVGSVPPPFPTEQCRGESCSFHREHDPETEEPRGTPCGRAATQIVFWRDRRFSPSCGQHGVKALDADALDLVLCVHPIEPAIVAEAHEVRS